MKNYIFSLVNSTTPYERMCIKALAGAIAVGAALGALVFFVQEPTYRSETVLAVVEQQPQGVAASLSQSLGGLSALVGTNLGGLGDRRPKYIAFLQSRVFTERFIKSLSLADDLFPERWDAASGSWREGIAPPTASELVDRFDEMRSLREDKFSGLLTLQIDCGDGRKAAEWANELVRHANADLRAQAIAESRRSIEFLRKELDGASVLELKQSIYKLMEGQVNAAMLANVREDYAFQVIDPAVVPDADKYIRPRLVMLVIGGMGAGVGVAITLLFVGRVLRQRASHGLQRSA